MKVSKSGSCFFLSWLSGMFGEVAALHRQEKASSDLLVATTNTSLPFLFGLCLYRLHSLAQNFHHHVAFNLEARFHHAGYALYGVERVSVINPRPVCIFAVSIPEEAYLCQYRQRSRSISSWPSKRTRRLLDRSCTCCAFNAGSTLW
jgi:hypothetical protein